MVLRLCFQEILVLRKSYVRPPLHVSGCEMAHLNTICVKLGIGHPCCDQLTAVKKGIRWPVSHDCIVGSGIQLMEVRKFFKVIRWPIDRQRRSIFLKVEFSLLSTYGQSIINWGRTFLKHPSRASLSALAKSIYYKLKARDTYTKPCHGLGSTSRMRTAIYPGQWQPWTAVLPFLGLISMA